MSLKLILGMVAIVLIIIGGMGGSDKLKRQILRHSDVEKIFWSDFSTEKVTFEIKKNNSKN